MVTPKPRRHGRIRHSSASSNTIAEREDEGAAQAQAGLVAVFRADEEPFAVEGIVECGALGAGAEGAGALVRATEVGECIFRLGAVGLHGGVDQQQGGEKWGEAEKISLASVIPPARGRGAFSQ